MAQELDTRILALRAELTRLVRDGQDEEGVALRRLLAELERLESFRFNLRTQAAEPTARPAAFPNDRIGGSHVSLAA